MANRHLLNRYQRIANKMCQHYKASRVRVVWLSELDATVFGKLCGGEGFLCGCYGHRNKTVYIAENLLFDKAISLLLHELAHHLFTERFVRGMGLDLALQFLGCLSEKQHHNIVFQDYYDDLCDYWLNIAPQFRPRATRNKQTKGGECG